MIKNIHFIWISRSNKPIPSQCSEFLEMWRKMYPDFNVRVWGNESFSEFIDDQLISAWKDPKYSECQVGNRLRALIVQKYGGIYADIDTKPLKRMDSLIEKSTDFVIGLTPAMTSKKERVADMNLFYSTPNHPVLNEILSTCPINEYGNLQANIYLARNDDDRITKYPTEYFQSWVPTENSYTLHWPYRLGSWKQKPK